MTDFAAARTIMVDRQVRPSDVTSFPIIDAMLRIPRERFAPPGQQNVAYAETPISLGAGREMLEPRAFAKMLDGARIGPDDFVLDLAPGLGYSTAVIAAMAAAVIAVEPDEGMAASASAAVEALEIDNAMVRQGDAAAGDAEHGPFDAIFVNGGVSRIPKALGDQLKEGGRLVAVDMSAASGRAVVYVRVGDQLQPRRLFDAMAPVLPGFEADEGFSF
ncbi:MAG: protein-L-isoaspartate O-methyltransferase [Pseudomonadota bacterium]